MNDKSGLVVHHEISPEAIATIKKIGEGIQKTRPVVYFGAGTVFGLLFAGGLWYAASAAKQNTKRSVRKKKRRKNRRS